MIGQQIQRATVQLSLEVMMCRGQPIALRLEVIGGTLMEPITVFTIDDVVAIFAHQTVQVQVLVVDLSDDVLVNQTVQSLRDVCDAFGC